ncbi:hypothetical protein [uncultured Thiocystis sp.]|jgi:hypothetical protein|uniref:hypothetical protein n=1 Tax=uncultured Thiocystis sp. TaxID=1202134 RepID=UPI0025FF88AF|nr:hypothetical protein [uncultured Thiocystis sp.]
MVYSAEEMAMEISSTLSIYQPVKPSKPAEPIPPAGGNIEYRQPPAEPSAPVKPIDNVRASDSGQSPLGSRLDVSA